MVQIPNLLNSAAFSKSGSNYWKGYSSQKTKTKNDFVAGKHYYLPKKQMKSNYNYPSKEKFRACLFQYEDFSNFRKTL